MGATPLRATAVEQALVAGEDDPAAHMAEGTDPASDVSASAEFRSHLARVDREACDRGGAQPIAITPRTITTPGSST